MIQIAIMGLGTVGTGVAKVVAENARQIERKLGEPLQVKTILVRHFKDGPYRQLMTDDFTKIEEDHAIRVVVETIGGLHPAYEYVRAALESGRCARYVTDFPTPETLALPGCVCIPHLGASTPESEENCAVMAARQLRDYLLDGNIANSVNFPAVSMPRAGAARVCVIHRNVPGILAGITQAATAAKLNIENMANKSKGEWAYTMLDLSGPADEQMARGIARLPDVVRVRVV